MANVGYVHDQAGPSAGDSFVISELQARGHTVTALSETATNPPPGGYDAFVVSESGSGSTVANFTSTASGVLVFETAWDTIGVASAPASSQGGSGVWDLDAAHPIAAGLPDPCTVHGGSNYCVTAANLAPDAQAVAVEGTGVTLAVVAAGDQLSTGTAPGPRGCAALIDSRTANLTADGLDLLSNTLDWMAGPSGPGQGSATGSHTWAVTATGEVPFPAPTNLVTTPVSPTEVDLAWDAVSGATGYDIERDGVVIARVPAASYSDSGLAPSTTYTYRVRGVK